MNIVKSTLLPTVLVFVLFTYLAASCTGGQGGSSGLPSSKGQPAEVVVLVEEGLLGQETYKNLISGCFEKEQPYLAQSERAFKILYVTPGLFKGISQQHQNIVVLATANHSSSMSKALKSYADTLKSQNAGSVVVVKKDLWAKPQNVIYVLASDEEELQKVLSERSDFLLEKVLSKEQEVIRRKLFEGQKPSQASTVLKEQHQVNLNIPSDYTVAVNKKVGNQGFVWFRKETAHKSFGLLVHYEPYQDTASFSLPYILNRRDSLTKLHVPGPLDNTYMTTYREYPIYERIIDVQGNYAKEVRGLWNVEGDFMGGPFISKTIVDQDAQRVLTLELFVYAPRFDKTPNLRELEAIMSTYQP